MSNYIIHQITTHEDKQSPYLHIGIEEIIANKVINANPININKADLLKLTASSI